MKITQTRTPTEGRKERRIGIRDLIKVFYRHKRLFCLITTFSLLIIFSVSIVIPRGAFSKNYDTPFVAAQSGAFLSIVHNVASLQLFAESISLPLTNNYSLLIRAPPHR